ncbi:amino acid ABC transporter permease [Ensifer sp. YR511]|uniref:amino acid ABC transporter permease n=1 Tax=Ensifer sp. YR511 TaxID=1855294 RepID=UPI0008822852|nr:amino acid ABC transporter permease [Ensifer sp. YR511]SDN42896.1 general L-amino acid transport system permease protein [Ensifer sp. YR511]
MQKNSLGFVRSEMMMSEPAPLDETGLLGWIRKHLFSSVGDALLTILGLAILAYILPPFVRWAIIEAQWTGTDRTFCATVSQGGLHPDGWSGACWAFVDAKIEQFLFGRYPIAERWRVIICASVFICLFVPLLIPRFPRKVANAVALFGLFPVFAFFLLVGGSFGLSYVETPLWGGLMITLILSIVGITVSLALGTLLALGRRSEMLFVRYTCIGFIETVRGVPLVTVLFMASVMLPLFLPQGFAFDKLMRALVGVALFSSAYMAEVVRGGLQAISKGQYEGADSLGLTYWHKMGLVVLPQALRLVIPGIVNSFIGIFKDTSLVYIIGMFDLLGAVRQNFSDANWASPQTPTSGLVFAGFVFWLFCFSMSRYSIYMESRLNTGHQR